MTKLSGKILWAASCLCSSFEVLTPTIIQVYIKKTFLFFISKYTLHGLTINARPQVQYI
jgi:hypothetical protein